MNTKIPRVTKKSISFKCSPSFQCSIQRIMNERNIDKSSIIKLALYLLDGYMQQDEIKKLNIFQLVDSIEKVGPQDRLDFGDFCEK